MEEPGDTDGLPVDPDDHAPLGLRCSDDVGQRADAVTTFQLEGVGLPRAIVEQIRDSPMFDGLLAIAQSVAADRETVSEVAESDRSDLDVSELANGPIQAQASAVRERTGALFVVIANANGIRLSHPDRGEVGKHVSTDPTKALQQGDALIVRVPKA